MIVSITGHTNIEKALGLPLVVTGGAKYNMDAFEEVCQQVTSGVNSFAQSRGIPFSSLTFVSGMARGVDEVFAAVAIRNGLPLILSVPGSVKWHKDRKPSRGMRAQAVYYERILRYERLQEVFEINKRYDGQSYQFANFARNQHMVDISNGVFSFKAYNSTGTDDCTQRAISKNKFIGNLCITANNG